MAINVSDGYPRLNIELRDCDSTGGRELRQLDRQRGGYVGADPGLVMSVCSEHSIRPVSCTPGLVAAPVQDGDVDDVARFDRVGHPASAARRARAGVRGDEHRIRQRAYNFRQHQFVGGIDLVDHQQFRAGAALARR